MSPLISIIIPVYNTEKHLSKCLKSAINQSFTNIEIIIVNDCSPDNSEEIIRHYQQKDNRIIYLKHETNKGLLQARYDGMSIARGEYVLALDSDDWLDLNACKEIAKTIKRHSPEIIQISLKILTKNATKNANLLFNKLKGQECFEELFVKNTYVSWSIGSKVIKKSLLKRAYRLIPKDVYLINSEDFLQYYIATFFAASFIGCPKAIYNYNCMEVSGSGSVIKNRDSYLKWINSLEKLFEILYFFKEKYKINQLYPEVKNEEHHDYWIVSLFFQKTPLKDQQEFFPLFCQKIGLEKVFNILIQYYPLELVTHLIPAYKKQVFKPVKTIAFICDKMYGGGVERVAALLAESLDTLGYKLVIITENKRNSQDFKVPSTVCREVLGRCRYNSLDRILKKHQIDTVIFQDYWRKETYYDMFYLRLKGNITIINALHNSPLWFYHLGQSNLDIVYKKYYELADFMTVLSHHDQICINHSQKVPVIYMPNILTFDPLSIKLNSLNDFDIVSVGRLREEKNPLFLLDVFKKVIAEIPLVKLYLVGDGVLKEQIVTTINQLGLQESVFVTGYTTEVQQYYQKASIHVLPSSFEGQPMTWLEAKAYGIPSVVSRMDSVEFTQHKGAIIVEQNDIYGFAQAIIKLLKDEQYRKEMGREARESLENFSSEKTIDRWKQLLDEISNNKIYESDLIEIDPKLDKEKVLNLHENLKLEILAKDMSIYSINETSTSKKQKIRKAIKNVIIFLFKKILPKNSTRYNKIKQIVKKTIKQYKNSTRE